MNAFFALEPRWLGRDRFYKIYVTDQDIRGALIGRQVYDEESAHRQMIAPAQIFAPLMKLWADRIVRAVRLRETEYDSMVPFSDIFLRQDRLNFQIAKADILHAEVDRKKRLWTGRSKNAGTLRLRMGDHSEREWIIVGGQDIDSIARCLGHPCANSVQRREASRFAQSEARTSSAAGSRR